MWLKVNDFSTKYLDLHDEFTLFLGIISAQSQTEEASPALLPSPLPDTNVQSSL